MAGRNLIARLKGALPSGAPSSGSALALPSCLFADLPAPADNVGNVVRVRDIGRPPTAAANSGGALFDCDGEDWGPVNGQCTILSGLVPMFMPPNLTVGANGALTLSKDLDQIYNIPTSGNGGCYMYMTPGQVHAGSVAGWWYVGMSTVNAGTVYNNRYVSGWPRPPAIPAGLTTASVGATSSDAANDRVAMVISLPAGALGKYGRLRSRMSVVASAAGAGTRFAKVFFGGYSFHVASITNANTYSSTMGEMGAAVYDQRQRGLSYNDGSGLIGNAAYTPSAGSQNAAAAQDVAIALRNSSGADWIGLHFGAVELVR